MIFFLLHVRPERDFHFSSFGSFAFQSWQRRKIEMCFLLISSWKRCTRHKHRYILWVMKLPSFSGGNINSVNPPCDIQSSNMLDHLLSFISEEIRKKAKKTLSSFIHLDKWTSINLGVKLLVPTETKKRSIFQLKLVFFVSHLRMKNDGPSIAIWETFRTELEWCTFLFNNISTFSPD